MQAKMVVEAANSPLSPEADAEFAERGITVVPDILANAGGVVVSYLEWSQNLQQFRWDAAEVDSQLTKVMERTSVHVLSFAKEKGVSLRKAAYAIAVQRVAEAEKQRGTF